MSKQNLKNKSILTALFAALTCAGCFIQVPLPGGVPIVIQDMMAMLSGLILGPLYGTLAVLLFLILGSLGLPVFTGKGGINIILQGPTGGFLIGYMIAALVAGIVCFFFVKDKEETVISDWIFITIAALLATITEFVLGYIGFHRIKPDLDFSTTLAAVVIPFIPGNIIKLIVMVPLSKKIRLTLKKYEYD